MKNKTAKKANNKSSKQELAKKAAMDAKKLLKNEKLKLKKRRNVIEQLYPFVKTTFGENAFSLVKAIGEDGKTDDKIEKKSGLKIPEIRSLLNRLHAFGVVEYSREKNMQSGWFTYTWRINEARAAFNLLQHKKQLLESILNSNDKISFKCQRGCSDFAFEDAMEMGFKCPACEQSMSQVEKDNGAAINGLRKDVDRLQMMVNQI